MNRRAFLAVTSMTGIAPMASAQNAAIPPERPTPSQATNPTRKGRLNQSVCRWCYGSIPLASFAKVARELGLKSIELLNPDEWPIIAAEGLTCAVGAGLRANPIPKGLNREAHHEAIAAEMLPRLEACAKAGVPQQIAFSGNREGLSDADGLAACAKGLKLLTPTAERLGVTIVMELLNSKVDHGDYQCDRTAWGADLVQAVGSDRFKLLYDIYHMQIMEGDVIRTIRTHKDAIGHYHTAGNPGRNEIDLSQELNYKAICEAIVETGFTGYLAQEFIPTREPLVSLRESIEICDV